jgi:predicted DNA-binding WGR domain protein
MPDNVTVQATELTYCEPPSNKFYRTFALGDHWIAQWGRIGTVGQFKVNASPSADTAQTLAAAQCATKQAKGYSVAASATFSVPGSWSTNPAAHTAELDDLFRNCKTRAPQVAVDHDPPVPPGGVTPNAAPGSAESGGMEARLRAALEKARTAQP